MLAAVSVMRMVRSRSGLREALFFVMGVVRMTFNICEARLRRHQLCHAMGLEKPQAGQQHAHCQPGQHEQVEQLVVEQRHGVGIGMRRLWWPLKNWLPTDLVAHNWEILASPPGGYE